MVLLLLQDLDAGDLVVPQNFKGAGLYAAVADPFTRDNVRLVAAAYLQDLDAGDLVVTQDFKGAGLYAAVAAPVHP